MVCIAMPAACSATPTSAGKHVCRSTDDARALSRKATMARSTQRLAVPKAAKIERRGILLGLGAGLGLGSFAGVSSDASAKESIFIGEYNDPSHPGCRRSIDSDGRVYGADPVPIKPGAPCLEGEETTPWMLQAEFSKDDKTIAIDFDPIDEVKQGPVTGTWTGKGLQLPNGLWTKK